MEKLKATIGSLLKKTFVGRRYFQTKFEINIEALSGSLFDYWAVSRGLCVYRTIDLSAVPENKREAALKNQIPMISPFDSPGSYVRWRDGFAQVWLWDEAGRKNLERDYEVDQDTLIVLPEPALLENQQKSGMVAYQGADSHFIQFWSEGILAAEAAWEGKPSDAEVEHFARGLGIPNPSALSFGDVKFREHSEVEISRLLGRFERPIYLVTAVIALFVIGLQLGGITGIAYQKAELGYEIEQLKAEKQPVLALRQQVNELDFSNRRLSSLKSQSQMAIGAAMANALVEDVGSLTEWDYKNDQLAVVIVDPALDHEQYAARLEALSEFASVSLQYESRNNRLKINLEVPDAK